LIIPPVFLPNFCGSPLYFALFPGNSVKVGGDEFGSDCILSQAVVSNSGGLQIGIRTRWQFFWERQPSAASTRACRAQGVAAHGGAEDPQVAGDQQEQADGRHQQSATSAIRLPVICCPNGSRAFRPITETGVMPLARRKTVCAGRSAGSTRPLRAGGLIERGPGSSSQRSR
jgi:hypothetical protein